MFGRLSDEIWTLCARALEGYVRDRPIHPPSQQPKEGDPCSKSKHHEGYAKRKERGYKRRGSLWGELERYAARRRRCGVIGRRPRATVQAWGAHIRRDRRPSQLPACGRCGSLSNADVEQIIFKMCVCAMKLSERHTTVDYPRVHS